MSLTEADRRKLQEIAKENGKKVNNQPITVLPEEIDEEGCYVAGKRSPGEQVPHIIDGEDTLCDIEAMAWERAEYDEIGNEWCQYCRAKVYWEREE